MCEACYKERLDQELAERLSYRQQEIIVELFPGPDPPAHVTGVGGEGERRSRRVRKVSAVGGGRMTVKVNADTTVKDLKMTIWERMEVRELFTSFRNCNESVDFMLAQILSSFGISVRI